MATVYEIVTSKIVEKLDKGVVPWRCPWVNMDARNWQSKRAYRGINALLLEPGEYATWNQIKKAGGKVKKGEKGHIAIFWKMMEVEDEDSEDGATKEIPYMRYYKVWEINSQVEGLESKREEKQFDHDPVEEAEKIIEGYHDAPMITFANDSGAWYMPQVDKVIVPPLRNHFKAEEYYSTLFHELIHSTGHETRLNRKGITERAAFGDETYSFEELVAEIGSCFLCSKAGIEQATLDNSVSYIAGWRRFLQNDSKAIVRAAAQAQKAADYILEA